MIFINILILKITSTVIGKILTGNFSFKYKIKFYIVYSEILMTSPPIQLLPFLTLKEQINQAKFKAE